MAVNFDVDFAPLGKLGEIYQQAKQRQVLEQGLQQMGLPGNMSLAQLALQQQAIQRGDARDTRDFAFRQQQASPEHAAAVQRATLGVQNEFAPKTTTLKTPGGEEVTVERVPGGGYRVPTVQGMPTADPNIPAGVDPKAYRTKRAEQLANIPDDKVLEADKAVQAGTGAVKALTKALELSKTAHYGPFASKIGYAGSLVGHKPSEDTEILSSTVTNQALENLRAVFGGNPTEGERKILLDVQGAVNQAPAVREAIYSAAIESANNRIAFNKQNAEQMRAGRYLLPEGQRSAPASAPSAGALPRVTSPAEAAKLPKGTRFLDPNGVERVVP